LLRSKDISKKVIFIFNVQKRLLGPSNYKNFFKFTKSHIYRVLGASKVKTDFSTYFSKAFLGQKYSKKILKQHILYKLDKGYRLLYELSYSVEKEFWSIFVHIEVDPYQKKVDIFCLRVG
jgi:hypothetical protein